YRKQYRPGSSDWHRNTAPPQREYRPACVLLQRYLTPHRMASRRVSAYYPVPSLSEACGPDCSRPGLRPLTQPVWYTRLSRGSTIRTRLSPSPTASGPPLSHVTLLPRAVAPMQGIAE